MSVLHHKDTLTPDPQSGYDVYVEYECHRFKNPYYNIYVGHFETWFDVLKYFSGAFEEYLQHDGNSAINIILESFDKDSKIESRKKYYYKPLQYFLLVSKATVPDFAVPALLEKLDELSTPRISWLGKYHHIGSDG